MLISRF